MTTPHVVIVGGGISGLAAAHALATGVTPPRITVLEGSPRLGGKLAGDVLEGIPVDLGAESVLARRPEAVDLIKAVGLTDDVVHPATTKAGLWIADGIHAIPPTVMGVPTDARAVADVLGPSAAARVAAEVDLPAPALTEDVSIGRYVAERMGQSVTDKLVDPLLGGVYAGRADEISLAAAVPELFARLAEAPSLLAATAAMQGGAKKPGPVFAGIRGGVHRLITALEDDLTARGVTISTKQTVRRISRTASGFALETGPAVAPVLVEADAVIVATPALPTSRMLTDLVPSASAELATVDYASMAIVTLAVRREAWPEAASGSGFLVPSVEGRTIKASTYSHAKWEWSGEAGGDLVVLRASVGRLGEEYVLQRSDEELVALAAADLRNAIGLTTPVVGSLVTRWGGALPQYSVGHLDRVDRVERAVAAVPGLAVCGAAYQGVGIAACVASGTRAATRVRDHLGPLVRMNG
ncbi:protoporphyrinogen oxidase [Kribbella sp. NBC_01245]|uniref:protoporphyrinogen oxidase n=1 Tax=Kribbella sp. NBC_01245 TaxID=2903578 RepID=UPI002E2AC662|nr:protoporphyrinogen oxidase [Kribbella sp. NBC_01245]